MFIILFLISIDARYHTLDEIAVELDTLARDYPTITLFDTIGYSTEDSLPIYAFKISDNAALQEDEPRILYVACHHAEELLGIEICMYMIQDLLSNYGSDSLKTHWIDNREIWFIPLLNPEGQSVVMMGIDTTWRKNKRDNNNNGMFDLTYDGVDPNRNYDFYWSHGGSSDPGSEYYRGPLPFSENETQVMDDLCAREKFQFCITYHSARTGLAEVVYYPWVSYSQPTYPPDFFTIRDIALSIARLIIKDDSSGHYTSMAGQGLDGKTRNWLYGVYGAFTFCIEVSTTTIQPGWMVDGICQRNLPGAYYLMDRVNSSCITGHIRDGVTDNPLAAEVIVNGSHVSYDANLPPRLSDAATGRFYYFVTPDTFSIEIRMPGYITHTLSDIVVTDIACTDIGTVELQRIERTWDVQGSNSLQIFPNPARKFLMIYMNNPLQFRNIRVYDVMGRVCKAFDDPVSSPLIWSETDDVQRRLANGVYYVVAEQRVYDQLPGPRIPDHILITEKIIITH